jgi:DinB family protein
VTTASKKYGIDADPPECAAVRASSVALLRGLDDAAWERRAPADWTRRSVRAIAYNIAGHERHHLADIRRQHGG